MFVALELLEPEKSGIFRSMLNIITRPKAQREERVVDGERFSVIRAPAGRHGPAWEKIVALALPISHDILLPDGLTPPADCGLRPLTCPRHRSLVLLSAFCEIIQQTRMPMYRRVAGLVDRDGSNIDMLGPILKYYTTVRVFTDRPDLYEGAAEQMMELFGAPVQVSGSLSSLSGCVLILAPDGLREEGGTPLPCPVLTGPEPPAVSIYTCLHDLRVNATPQIRAACPCGISPHRLAAALFEYCDRNNSDNVKVPNFSVDNMLCNFNQVSFSWAVREVMRCSGTL